MKVIVKIRNPVSEGPPDKVRDAISDAVLDGMAGPVIRAIHACEILVNN
jgi:S-adenosylmethionine synthetase